MVLLLALGVFLVICWLMTRCGNEAPLSPDFPWQV